MTDTATAEPLQVNDGPKAEPSPNRNAQSYFLKKAGCCTRCHGPFRGKVAFIVCENVAWQFLIFSEEAGAAFTQHESVPVCTDCVDVAEQARATSGRTCLGCELLLKSTIRWKGRYCSERCEQRHRRRRSRERRDRNGKPKFCTGCGTSFKPRRKDAKYHSNACRQATYRRCQVPARGISAADYRCETVFVKRPVAVLRETAGSV